MPNSVSNPIANIAIPTVVAYAAIDQEIVINQIITFTTTNLITAITPVIISSAPTGSINLTSSIEVGSGSGSIGISGTSTSTGFYVFQVTVSYAGATPDVFQYYEFDIFDFNPKPNNLPNPFALTLGTNYTTNTPPNPILTIINGVNIGSAPSIIQMSNVPAGITIQHAVGTGADQSNTLIYATGIPTTQTSTSSILSITEPNIGTGSGSLSIASFGFQVNLSCVAAGTLILMANGLCKPIESIRRGDIVAGNPENALMHKVSRVIRTSHVSNTVGSFIKFGTNSLLNNIPFEPLIVTNLHPIIFDNSRRHAKYFGKVSGVTNYHEIRMDQIMIADDDQTIYLYDLQFDTIGSFVANGVTLQSRHPRSFITPLPKKDYFDEKLYSDNLANDNDLAFDFPLIDQYY